MAVPSEVDGLLTPLLTFAKVGDRMLEEVDENVVLAPMSRPDLRSHTFDSDSGMSEDVSNRNSLDTLRTAESYPHTESSESDGMSYIGSPTPGHALPAGMISLNRHSIECDRGTSTRPSFDDSDGNPSARPSFDSDRPALPGVRGHGSLAVYQHPQYLHSAAKQSTRSSLFSLSSVNSSPCPRPPGGRRKLLMLTGNRLPRPPLAAPKFTKPPQSHQARPLSSESPPIGRVRELKDSWEAKCSPKKDETIHCRWLARGVIYNSLDECAHLSILRPPASGSSPRFVRPLPTTLAGKVDIPRPQLLATLSLKHGSPGKCRCLCAELLSLLIAFHPVVNLAVPPDTPPPSSPSASERSMSISQRSSLDGSGGRTSTLFTRMQHTGRRPKSHRRHSSQFSRSSIIAEPIQEESTGNLTAVLNAAASKVLPAIPVEGSESDTSLSPSSNLQAQQAKAFSPLVIRKKAQAARISMGMDSFQLAQQKKTEEEMEKEKHPAEGSVQAENDRQITVIQEDRDWEDVLQNQTMKWARFCQEAVSEIQKR